MTTILVQLSDIHLKSGADPVAGRAIQIAAAIASTVVEPAVCLLVYSGDLAYGGSEAQYKSLQKFDANIKAELNRRFPDMRVARAMVPGNHDCDFATPIESREIVKGVLLDRIANLKEGSDVVELMTLVQSNFFDFAKKLGAWSDKWNRLYWEIELEAGSDTLRVQCYNTAWTSSLAERAGTLLYPVAIADTHHASSRPVSLSISILHHPMNWFHPINAQAFREHLDRTADLVLTGHEHRDRSYVVQDDGGTLLRHLEGGVLQEHGTPQSDFQVLVIEVTQRKFKRLMFAWKGSRYESGSNDEWKSFERNPNLPSRGFSFSASYLATLEDCGIEFAHPRKGRLSLSDIFVYPDFRLRSADQNLPKKKSRKERIAGKEFINRLRAIDHAIVAGAATSGKTSLAKRIVSDLRLTQAFVPVLLAGRQLRSADRDELIKYCENEFKEQYSATQLDGFRQLERAQRAIVIDDFHLCKLNKAARNRLLGALCGHSGLVVALVDDLYLFEVASSAPLEVENAPKSAVFEISDFGWRLRGELIARWHRLGSEDVVSSEDLAHQVERSENVVASLIGKNLLPSHPLTVLTILQTQELASSQSAVGGSFGYLYEHLITTSLSKISSRLIDIDTRYAYVSHIAYAMFSAKVDKISSADLKRVTQAYAAKIRIDFSEEREIDELVNVRILESRGDLYSFKYKYVYCYFVARYFRDHKATQAAIKEHIQYLADRIHVEEYSNILTLYVYVSRDLEIVQYLLQASRKIFGNFEPSDLEVGFVSRLFKETKPLALPEGNADARREEVRQNRDEAEDSEPELDDEPRDATYRDDLTDIVKINFSFKTLQILGQVLRNFLGSLSGDLKEEIATECYLLGLRTLSAFLNIAEEGFDEFRVYFAALIKEQRPMASRSELAREADELIIWLTLGCAYGILKKVGTAVGVEDLRRTYDDVLRRLGETVPVRMIDIGIKLDHFRHPPIEVLERLSKDVKDKKFASALLRELVMNYLYLYRTEDFVARQKLGAMFEIEATKPNFLENPDKRN